jgi:uridine kinase
MKYVKKTKKYADIIIKEDTIISSNAFAILSKKINQILN